MQPQDISNTIENQSVSSQNYIKLNLAESQKRKIESEKDIKINLAEPGVKAGAGNDETKSKKGTDFQQHDDRHLIKRV